MSFKTLSSIVFLAIGGVLYAQNAAQSYLETFTAGAFKPQQPPTMYHMNDGEHYAALNHDSTQIVAYEYVSGRETACLFDVATAKNCQIKKIAGFALTNNEQKILIHTAATKIYRRSATAAYYVYTARTNTIEPLSDDNVIQAAAFSPDGRMIAFARHNNLFIKKLDFGTEIAITTDGATNNIINGTPDWVYEEEFGLTRCFEWNADSKLLAYIRFDESAVHEFSFQNFTDDYPTLTTYKYPRAGSANSQVSLRVYDVQNRTTKTMQTGDDTDIYLPQIRWNNDAETLTAVRLNRNQTVLDLLAFNARSGVGKRLYHEQSDTYIDYANLNCLHFCSDNSFIIMSDKSGYRTLYQFAANGTPIKQWDAGANEAEITDFYGYDEKTGTIYFQSTLGRPTERYVVSSRNNNLVIYDRRHGWQAAEFSKNFKYAIYRFSNSTEPDQYTIINGKGKTLRTLEDNAALATQFEQMQLPVKEFVQITTDDGITLNGWIVKPKNTTNDQPLPLVMLQYSGPDSQEARNRWDLGWEYYLAQLGYVVACVDGRGTGGRGRDFRTCTYKHLGELEAQDQIAAAHYLGNLDYVDAERIAIWGWSYGGFTTLYCLTHGNGTFKAGIAIAPVTDWRYYDTAYAERFMQRPQENDRGYDTSSLINKADHLQGRLLLIHSTADDNVHTQQTWLYIEKLVEAGKQFEMQMYPNKNHSILGAKTRLHLYTRCTEFLQKNL
ncbi:MAG: S9 family peptidase [Paludibacteraceae bacterium]